MIVTVLGKIFQSTLSVRRATIHEYKQLLFSYISIHALREESDNDALERLQNIDNFNPRSPWGERPYGNIYVRWLFIFQSTLSVRRATGKLYTVRKWLHISIHALREESDQPFLMLPQQATISIHALREESDFYPTQDDLIAIVFQSTLSVRRATLYTQKVL